MKPTIILSASYALFLSFPVFAMQPLITLTGGAVNTLGQHSQSLTFENTVFNYSPQSSSYKPLSGLFVGEEYTFNTSLAWQFGLSFYQASASTVHGQESQAPLLSLDAVNLWNYHYKVLSRQLFVENKLLLVLNEHYRPYLLVGLGKSFNHAYAFQVARQNSGEVATAIFTSHYQTSFIYSVGLGMDVDVLKQWRIGAGYRLAYLGAYSLGNGVLNTGAGGDVFSLPALKSSHTYNHEILIQLTYLI
jgi:opacity protein-like surface antigen